MGCRKLVNAILRDCEKTYKAIQVLAPFTGIVVLVKVVEENDENNNDHDKEGRSNEPPSPPERLSSFEESDRVLEKVRRGLTSLGGYGCI